MFRQHKRKLFALFFVSIMFGLFKLGYLQIMPASEHPQTIKSNLKGYVGPVSANAAYQNSNLSIAAPTVFSNKSVESGIEVVKEVKLDAEQQISDHLAEVLGLKKSEFVFSVSSESDTHMVGTYIPYDSTNGAYSYWLASFVSGKWQLVFHGDTVPPCTIVSAFDFPKEFIGRCENPDTGEIISLL